MHFCADELYALLAAVPALGALGHYLRLFRRSWARLKAFIGKIRGYLRRTARRFWWWLTGYKPLVKPTGYVSTLGGSTPGIEPVFAATWERRVRLSKPPDADRFGNDHSGRG